jgi:hypothetical protein
MTREVHGEFAREANGTCPIFIDRTCVQSSVLSNRTIITPLLPVFVGEGT